MGAADVGAVIQVLQAFGNLELSKAEVAYLTGWLAKLLKPCQ
jgi:hypothetical protein